jgi:hypothetical protein
MILRLSDSLSRALIVLAAVVCALVLSFFSLRMGLAANFADQESVPGYSRAVRMEPDNAEYWYRFGHFQQFNLEEPDPAAAVGYFQKAIALDPNYTDAWLDLGTSYELDGNVKAATDAYHRAQLSYPASAEVAWRNGNFLLRQGQLPEAFQALHLALQLDPKRAAAAFSRCYRAQPDVDLILDKVLPASPAAYVDVIAETASQRQLAVSLIVWKRLIALQPHLVIHDFDLLVTVLFQEKEYAEAQRVWDEGVATMGLPPLLAAPDSVVWDASFESGLSNNTLSWHYQSLEQGVQTSLDTSEKLSGNQSLRLTFDGKHNPNLRAPCISNFVDPGRTYHFSGWIKTKSITTQQGIGFLLIPGGATPSPAVSTREIHDTNPWTYLDTRITAGVDTRRVDICVVRNPSDDPDVRISGSAWIDDVNLAPEPAGQRKP